MADARRRRRARRVLRPDRRLRRPGRRARRGVPGGRPGSRAAAAARRRSRGRGRGTTPTSATEAEPATTATADGDDEDEPTRVTMRLAAAELVESREILPGQWLQAYHAPGPRDRVAGRPVRPRPDRRLLRAGPAPAVLDQHGRPGDRHRDDPLPGHRARHRVVHPPPAGRPDRPARSARPAVRGGSAQPAPAARRRRARDRRRPDARRRGDPGGPPGDAPVRRRVGPRGLPVHACCPTRSSTSSPPTTARSATTAS